LTIAQTAIGKNFLGGKKTELGGNPNGKYPISVSDPPAERKEFFFPLEAVFSPAKKNVLDLALARQTFPKISASKALTPRDRNFKIRNKTNPNPMRSPAKEFPHLAAPDNSIVPISRIDLPRPGIRFFCGQGEQRRLQAWIKEKNPAIHWFREGPGNAIMGRPCGPPRNNQNLIVGRPTRRGAPQLSKGRQPSVP